MKSFFTYSELNAEERLHRTESRIKDLEEMYFELVVHDAEHGTPAEKQGDKMSILEQQILNLRALKESVLHELNTEGI